MREIKSYTYLPECALNIRVTVFVDEQGFVDDEDEIDKIALHLVSYDGETPIATCRIFKGDGEGSYLLGRFAVMKEYRGRGVGRELIGAAEQAVRELGGTRLALHSQYDARGFYEKCGYVQEGELEYEQDCPHVWMIKIL